MARAIAMALAIGAGGALATGCARSEAGGDSPQPGASSRVPDAPGVVGAGALATAPDPDGAPRSGLRAASASIAAASVCDAAGWCWLNPLPSGTTWLSATATTPGSDAEPSVWIGGEGGWLLQAVAGGRWRTVAAPLPSTQAMWSPAGGDDLWLGGVSAGGAAALVRLDASSGMASPVVELGPGAISDIWGRDARDIFAVGYMSGFHWDGETWSSIPGVTGTSVVGDSAGNVFVGAPDGMWRLQEGRWLRVPELDGQYVIGLAASPGGRAWAAALHDGVTDVLQFDGSCWNIADRVQPSTDGAVNVDAIGAASDSDVWVVGTRWVGAEQRGYLLHYDGRTWSNLPDAPTALTRVAAAPGGGLVAVGRGGGMVSLVSGSAPGWTDLRAGSAAALRGIWAAGPNEAWAVGSEGTILHVGGAGDGGAVASMAPLPVDLADVFGRSSQDVWAVGRWGTAFHFDGGRWSTVTTGARADLHAVFDAGPSDVWLGGDGGTLLHGNGQTFAASAPTNADSTLDVTDIHGTAPNDVWLTGGNAAGAVVAHFDGNAWSPLRILAGANASAPGARVWAVAPNDVWVLTRYAVAGAFDYWHFDGATWTERVGAPSSESWMFPRPGQGSGFALSPDARWWAGDFGAIERQLAPR